MIRHVGQTVASKRGSAKTIVMLVLVTLVVVAVATRRFRQADTAHPIPQAAEQVESRAFYIAQTALDRSIKALVANPDWRDGFDNVPFESGTYNVKLFDTQGENSSDQQKIPPNYVRIIATSEIEGVHKEVEAVWVNAMSAFQHAYSAGNHIELANHGERDVMVRGDVHNNAWRGGTVDIYSGTRLYGNVTSLGDVHVGVGDNARPAVVFGNVWGSTIDIAAASEIERFEGLNEWNEGIDLNGDGDANDIGVDRGPMRVIASKSVVSGGRPVANGETNRRIDGGSLPASVGENAVGPIVDPRPDFAAYYELVTGLSSYPPGLDHVSTPILGDGDGRYFSSARAFIDWLHFQNESVVWCWRCAGDGRVDPGNTSVCPACNGSGRVSATEVSGVFYIDSDELDLSEIGRNLVIHGTIVVAKGNPYEWPSKTIDVPGGSVDIEHFPERGDFVLRGENRMHFTQTYRSDEDNADYNWSVRTVFSGENAEAIALGTPDEGNTMRDFPAIIVPGKIVIEPRHAGFAYNPGDIGDERLTILQGVLYGETEVRLHGRGGWSGESIVFDEMKPRAEDEALDEAVLNIDLNGDNDIFDRVEMSAISTVPVIPTSKNRFTVDINNDGVLDEVTIGVDYLGFFDQHNYLYPILIYHEGLILSQNIHTCEETLVTFDRKIAASGIPFGFEVSFGSTTYQGLVSWWEHRSP